jgi:MFS superfamily sulfate permease-like transporter
MPPATRPRRARPALITALQHYDRRKALADLIAGVTVGLVALPLALAFAIRRDCPHRPASTPQSSPAD